MLATRPSLLPLNLVWLGVFPPNPLNGRGIILLDYIGLLMQSVVQELWTTKQTDLHRVHICSI